MARDAVATVRTPGRMFPDGSPNLSRDEALRFRALIEYARTGAGQGLSLAQRETLSFIEGWLSSAAERPTGTR